MGVFYTPGQALIRTMLVLVGLGLAAACTAADRVSQDAETRTSWDGVYTQKQAERGQQVVEQHCAVCHGRNLFGSRAAPAIAGTEMLFVWDGRTLAELLDTMRSTMPPGQIGTIDEASFVNIMARMLQASGFPSAETVELSRSAAELQQVVIKREKPQ